MSSKRKRRTAIAGMMTALFFLWQINAIAHLMLVEHEICAHGKIVDKPHHEGHHHALPSSPNDGHPTPDNEKEPNHDNCGFLLALTAPQSLVGPDTPPLDRAIDVPSYLLVLNDELVLPSKDLFLLSPSHSPPSAA